VIVVIVVLNDPVFYRGCMPDCLQIWNDGRLISFIGDCLWFLACFSK